MAYNREDMITWNELAPSLQTVLKGYESGIEALNSKYQEEHLSLTDVEGNLATFIQNQQVATEALQHSMDELNSTQTAAKTNLEQLNSNQSQIKETCDNIRTETKENLDSIEATQEQIKTTINSIDGRLEELNATQNQVKNLASSLDVNVSNGFLALNQSCSRMETTATSIKESGIALREACGNLDTTCGLIKSSLTTISNTADSLYTTCKSLETTCSNINNMVTNINVNVQSISTYGGNIDTACRTLSQTCTGMKTVLDETKEVLSTNHAEIKELLESIKESGINTGGGGSTNVFDLSKVSGGVTEFGALTQGEQKVADSLKIEGKTDEEILDLIRLLRENSGEVVDPNATFKLDEVEGGVTEFGTLTTGEQAAANALKQEGKSDADVVAWLRVLRNNADSGVFKLSDVEGATEEFGELTNAEQAATNALKKGGSTNTEILEWLRAYRAAQEPEVVFNLSDVEGAVEEFGSLDVYEQATANAMKKDGKTNEEIIAWLKAHRLESAVFDITVNQAWVNEFGSLTSDEQTLANNRKRNGQTDEQIIAWLRAKRQSESVFVLEEVEGAVAEFGSLSSYEQQQATTLKRQGKSNEEILQWIRDYRYSQAFHLSDVEGATEEFGSLTEDEQVLANNRKQQGQTNDEIIEWLRARRLAESVFDLSEVEGGVEEFGELTTYEQQQATTMKRSGSSNEEILQWIRDYRYSLVFHLADVEGAEAEFGSLTEDEQDTANTKKQQGQTDEQIIEWLRAKRLAESVFVLEDVEGAAEEFGSLSEIEQTNCNSLKRAGKTDEEILQWLRDYRASLVFSLDDIEGAAEEFGALSESEQTYADTLKQAGKSDEEILDWLRQTRREENSVINNYADIMTNGVALDSHKQDADAHRGHLISSTYMMYHPATSYDVGDIVYIGELPLNLSLMATTKGVTSSTRPDFASILGITGTTVTTKDEDTLLQERYAALNPKVATNSTTINAEIAALHKEVYDHTVDQDAHDMTTTTRLLHKTNHEYNVPGTRVLANNLDPNFVLELYQTGTTAATAPGAISKGRQGAYSAPVVTAANRTEIMEEIEQMLDEHKTSALAHRYDVADYLFETNSSGYQYVPVGNAWRLCSLVS